MADNVIASFLVALGFQSNQGEQKKAEKSVNDFEKAVRDAEAKIVAARRDRAKTTEQLTQLELQQNLKTAQAALRAAKEQEKASAASVKAIKDAEAKKNKAQAESTAFSIAKINLFIEALKTMANAARHALSDTVAGFDQLYYAAGRTGATVNNLRSLGHAFGQVGGSSAQALQTVESFTRALRNNPGLQGFVKGLGVSDKLDGVEKLLATVDKLNEQPRYIAVQQAGMLGISEESFDLLTRQSEGVKRYRREYKEAAAAVGLNEEEASKASHRFSQSMGTLSMIMEVSFSKLLTDMLPRISGWLDTLANWIRSHQEEIGTFVRTVAGYIEQFGAFIEKVFNALREGMADGSLQKQFNEFVSSVKEIAAAFGTVFKFLQAIGNTPVWQAIKFAATWPSSLLGGVIGGAQAATGGGGAAGGAGGGAAGGGIPAPADTRTLREKYAPKIFGGKDAPSAPRGVGRALQSVSSRAIIAELKAAGYKDNAIAAIVGSMQTESSFNPRARNEVGGGHTGLWQWDKNRWPKIENWIKGQGGDPYDSAWQTKAWIAEHNAKPGDALYDHPRTARGGEILRGDPTIDEAIHGVRESERFGAGEEMGRGANARAWLPHINGTAGTTTGADLSGKATYSNGQLSSVKGFVMHHTGGRGTPESVVNTLNQRGLGVQYVMDRDGKVYQTLPSGARGAHIKPAQNGSGLDNSNTMGMEVIAKNDKDITPEQVASAKAFLKGMEEKYPGLQVFGHGELNSHKQEDEGKTIVDAFRNMPKPAPGTGADPARLRGLDVNPTLTSPGPMGANSNVDNSQANRAISQNNNVKVEIHGSSDPARQANKMEAALSRVHQLSLENAQGAVGA
jgi:hypothetical protein